MLIGHFLSGTGKRTISFMPFLLNLPKKLQQAGWKVKVLEKERLEPPHVTIFFKRAKWRYGLRERAFLDPEPDPKEIPDAIMDELDSNYPKLCRAWNDRYPKNPVSGADEEK
jgi:hypothetical protein